MSRLPNPNYFHDTNERAQRPLTFISHVSNSKRFLVVAGVPFFREPMRFRPARVKQ